MITVAKLNLILPANMLCYVTCQFKNHELILRGQSLKSPFIKRVIFFNAGGFMTLQKKCSLISKQLFMFWLNLCSNSRTSDNKLHTPWTILSTLIARQVILTKIPHAKNIIGILLHILIFSPKFWSYGYGILIRKRKINPHPTYDNSILIQGVLDLVPLYYINIWMSYVWMLS